MYGLIFIYRDVISMVKNHKVIRRIVEFNRQVENLADLHIEPVIGKTATSFVQCGDCTFLHVDSFHFGIP